MSDALTAARRAARIRKARRQDHPFLKDLRKARSSRRVNSYVTPAEITKVICRRTGAPKHIVWPIIDEFISVAIEALESGKDLKLRSLGTLYWKRVPKRDGFRSRLDGKVYNLPERRKLKWLSSDRFKEARPAMEKYGVKLDDEKVKQALKGKDNVESCPDCDKKLDSGGACPEHGTEPLEQKRD